MFDFQEIPPPKYTKTPVKSPNPISPFSSVGSSSSIRIPPKRTSTSAAPAMTQAAIRQPIANSVVATLKAQAVALANTENTNRNSGPRFLGQVANLVASITLDSARYYVMQCAFLTQGTVSSICTILSRGGSIRPEGFLPSILLWLVIIVAVVSGGVIVVVVAAIRQPIADSVVATLKAQAIALANTENTNRNSGPRVTPIARKCTYKEFMSCQPFYFNGTKGAVVSFADLNGLNRYFLVAIVPRKTK
nr:hypothetical protein [Tanacetum cinerariifolium]